MKRVLLSCVILLAIVTIRAQGDMKAYNNYDFVPGENILFEDNFTADQEGEFPSHWNLKSGQGVVNKKADKTCFLLTQGNYVKVFPLMKTESYLADSFTIELDFLIPDGGYAPMVFFKSGGNDSKAITLGFKVSTNSFSNSLSEAYPDGSDASFKNKWHHAAIAYKKGQMKIYEDQYRVLVIPQCGFQPQAVLVGGIGSDKSPLIFTNMRIDAGVGMNMLNKILTDGKFVTHAITFDVNKAVIKPESMGFLNSLAKFLADNKTVKLEIDGHTDSDGDDASNMKLSQARAESVKAQLVSMGIETSRLTTKGFGESKPISDNTSAEGKANNRRVEFVKQ